MRIRHHQHQAPPPGSGPVAVSRRRGRRGGERGIILPLTALSVVALLCVATVVIDGSAAYPQRRGAQNAADAASLAATRALDKARWYGGSDGAVLTTAQAVAADNGAESSECWIIDSYGNTIGGCADSVVIHRADAAGVQVRTTDRRNTTFGPLVGRDAVEARATAAATVQVFVGGTGVPFIICGDASYQGWDILNADGSINVAKASLIDEDHPIPIESPQGHKAENIKGCGAGSAFKGKMKEGTVVVSLPGEVGGQQGNGYNDDIAVEVAGAKACTPEDLESGKADCELLVPIAKFGTGDGDNVVMNCTAWAIFHIYPGQGGHPRYWGYFVAAATYVTGGITIHQGPTDSAQPRVIRLIK